MPIFCYSCPSCGTDTDVLFSVGDRTDTYACRNCGKVANRVLSPVSFVVTGGTPKEESGRVKKQLTKRMLDHEKTPVAKEERRHRIRQMSDKGYPL